MKALKESALDEMAWIGGDWQKHVTIHLALLMWALALGMTFGLAVGFIAVDLEWHDIARMRILVIFFAVLAVLFTLPLIRIYRRIYHYSKVFDIEQVNPSKEEEAH